MKKFSILIFIILMYQYPLAQIIFQDRFNTLQLSTYTTAYASTQYTTVPGGYIEISEKYKNNPGSSLNPIV